MTRSPSSQRTARFDRLWPTRLAGSTRLAAGGSTRLAASALLLAALWTPRADPVPPHGVAAANLDVVVNSFDNTASSVTATASYAINDFRVRAGSNNGDYNIQIGEDVSDDVTGGVLMTSLRQNGRDNGHLLYPGTNFVTSHLGFSDTTTQNGYWIPVCLTLPNATSTSVIEYDMNVAAAWFPYDKWIAGYAHYSDPVTMNNTTLDAFRGSPGLELGTHFIDLGNASYTVDLTSLGIDSRKDGVLLVLGAKNEDNYALSHANADTGTWTVWSKDSGDPAGERDPVAFVFVPKTDTTVVSGRFLADGTIDMFSGTTPRFTVQAIDYGQWELKINGLSPAHGVLIVSPEGGMADNADNIVCYDVNTAGDGWIIQSRDIPAMQEWQEAGYYSWINLLETPVDPTEPIASFAFILGATPGFTVTPTENLETSEYGGTATFAVVLDTQPTAAVTIGVSSSDPTEGAVSPASLTFTPEDWDQPQTVVITGQDDDLEDGPIVYTVILAPATSADLNYNGLNPADATVLNADSEVGITVSPTGGLITTEEGGAATFTVQLNTAPSANVAIAVESSDPTEGGVSPSTLTFTPDNWSMPQTVTVTGVDDPVDDGDIAYTIVTAAATSTDPAYNGKNALDVAVTNIDNDTVGILVDPVSLSIVEGATASFSVVLGSQPASDVVVTVTSGNAAAGPAAPTTLAFTPQTWGTPQTVTVTAVDNLVGGGDVAFTVENTVASSDPVYAAIEPADVAVTLQDNDATVALPAEGVVYGSGMPAIAIASRATVTDPLTAHYDQGKLTVAVTANGSPDDRLEIRSTGSDVGQIAVSGSEVSYEGTPIGTLTGGVGIAPLVVALNNAATPAAAQALIRAVTFRNVNSSPATGVRSVTLTLTDADNGAGTGVVPVRVGLLRVAEFQQGVDRGYGVYTGAADCELTLINPEAAYPMGHNGNGLWVDAQENETTTDACQVLMRFDDIAGTGPGQIPPTAIIVSAELWLTVPPTVSNAQGDASPLYRMLVDWDPETSTYNGVGNGYEGFVPDDIHARSTYDSFLGLANGDANTGTGTFSLGVTADVEAWVNAGEPNHGWLMPGWPTRLDGTAFSPSEASNPDYRPRLRVLWLPAGTARTSFRQDVNEYYSAQDTRIRANAPDADSSTIASVYVDYFVSAGDRNEEQVLIQFGDIIGTEPGQIPPGSRIDVAMLDLASMVGNAMGDGGTFHAMLKPWQHTDTWTMLDNGVTADGVEALETPSVAVGNPTLAPNVQAAFHSFEVSPDVQAWVRGARPNHGWVILPWVDAGDGWGFGTSEQADERNRPQLRVYYTPGAVEPEKAVLQMPVYAAGNVVLTFSGDIDRAYSIRRVGALGGAWVTIGTATVGAGGTATFTDSSPLPGAAFYQVVYP